MRTAEEHELRCIGRVLGHRRGLLRIGSTPGNGCPRCERGEGCGQALWGSRAREVRLDLPGAPRPVGAAVEITLPMRRLLHAAALAYGLPLVGLLSGAVVAGGLIGAGDAAVALTAAAGFAAGVLLARQLARRLRRALQPQLR